jgi:hypothetical protein
MNAGSGGWSFPTPKQVQEIDTLPSIQLFDLRSDPSETTNLQAEAPQKVSELTEMLTDYILNGRSTPGKKQSNDPIEGAWKQVGFMKK